MVAETFDVGAERCGLFSGSSWPPSRRPRCQPKHSPAMLATFQQLKAQMAQMAQMKARIEALEQRVQE